MECLQKIIISLLAIKFSKLIRENKLMQRIHPKDLKAGDIFVYTYYPPFLYLGLTKERKHSQFQYMLYDLHVFGLGTNEIYEFWTATATDEIYRVN